jgi:hypothetical protein
VSADPVFLRDPALGALLAFPSAEAAARHLRPWQEVSAVAAWDAEGGRLSFAVVRRRERFLGLLPRWREVVVASAAGPAAEGAAELRAALRAVLLAAGEAPPDGLPLAELAARAARRCWAGPPASP